jgi:excinuclease ABC subunit A
MEAAKAGARKPALGLDPRVAAGTPEDVAKEKRSYTGAFLKPVLGRRESGRGKKRSIEAAE